MNAIRLVDLSTISENSINSMNRYKAKTHLLWTYFSDSYILKDFLADDKPLLKVERPKYKYTVEQAIIEHVFLARRVSSKEVEIDEQFYHEVLTLFSRLSDADFRNFI